jgi:hypothetical protein
MTWFRFLLLLQTTVAIYFVGRLVLVGYRKHRALWTRASWVRLLLTLACALTLVFLPTITEIGVAVGYYSRDGMSANQRGIWILLALAAMFGGAIVLFGALGRFAQSEPGEAFTLSSWRRGLSIAPRRSA